MGCGFEVAVDLSGEVSLQAAAGLSKHASFGGLSFDVGAGDRLMSVRASQDGHVECSVEASVTATVVAMLDRFLTRCRSEADHRLSPEGLPTEVSLSCSDSRPLLFL